MTDLVRVQVEGLRDLQAGLRALDAQAPDALKGVFLEVSRDVVAASSGRVPRRSGKAARSYRASGTRRGASVRFGGPSAPYAPWLDWGGSTHVDGGSGPRDRVYRPFERRGRYLYPAIQGELENVQDRVVRAVEEVARRYGLKVD